MIISVQLTSIDIMHIFIDIISQPVQLLSTFFWFHEMGEIDPGSLYPQPVATAPVPQVEPLLPKMEMPLRLLPSGRL